MKIGAFKGLFDVDGLPSATVKNYGQTILQLIKITLESGLFNESAPKPIRTDALLSKLKSVMQKLAKELGADEKMLSKKNYNEQLYHSINNRISTENYVVPSSIVGWRRPYYEKAALLLQNNKGRKLMSKILCNIYKSQIKDEMYLYVSKVDELKKVPEQLLHLFGRPVFVTTMFIAEEKKLARANAIDVLKSISEKGYFLQMPPLPNAEMKELAEKNSKLAKR